MSETYTKLKAMLDAQGTLSKEDIEKAVAASGEMTAEEITLLEAERHEKERAKSETITMEQYLEASKVLDTAPEGSDEYHKALKIVEAYESGL
jgi:Ca2+-binding EF-hand superfamily protein